VLVTTDGVVEVSVFIAAAPETVFRYFTDPSRYVQWMGKDAVLEPVPGGCYRVIMNADLAAAGEFVEVDPPHRLVFTWGWTQDSAVPPGTTRVVVTLKPENNGTQVVLRHYGLPDDGQREHHRKGWLVYLDRLQLRVAGYDPGPDPNT
jgi:uncharacterized protein YndB with AHSA1/START domain